MPGAIRGAVVKGDVFFSISRSGDQNWVQIDADAWVMIKHPDLGTLLEPISIEPPPAAAPPIVAEQEKTGEAPKKELKKKFELHVTRKACGANLKSVDADGSSRDSLFDHLCVQVVV